ncbi:MAG: tRNA (adenine(22)-N(1))-methyltransferase TrmK, partial [Actinobacteria bacterium]|nr:tRNA (adenine(22)-N(1))-methyltransferase TrmK [Actinomycetota bacterium]
MYREPERVLTDAEARRFWGFTERRRRREPVAYIIGRRAFRTIELEVGPGALVPRPETETLVEVALAELARLDARLDRELGVDEASRDEGAPDAPASSEADRSGRPAPRVPKLLDVGTGSGAVALAVASEHPGVRAVGVDIDRRALEIAGRNVERLGLTDRVELRESDLFGGLPEGARFDLIVSNPPYLTEDELAGVEREVRVY